MKPLATRWALYCSIIPSTSRFKKVSILETSLLPYAGHFFLHGMVPFVCIRCGWSLRRGCCLSCFMQSVVVYSPGVVVLVDWICEVICPGRSVSVVSYLCDGCPPKSLSPLICSIFTSDGPSSSSLNSTTFTSPTMFRMRNDFTILVSCSSHAYQQTKR